MQRLIFSAALAVSLLAANRTMPADADEERAAPKASAAASAADGADAAAKVVPVSGSPAPQQPIMGRYPRFRLVAWSKGSTQLISTGDVGSLAKWETANDQLQMHVLLSIPYHAHSLATSQRSSKILLGKNVGKVELRDGWSLDLVREFQTAEAGNTYAVALSEDDQLFASSGTDRVVQIWSIADGKRLHVLGQSASIIKALAFSPDGAHLAAINQDGFLQVWNIADETLVGPAVSVAGGYYSDVRFDRHGKAIIVTDRGIVTFFDLKSGVKPRVVRAPFSVSPEGPENYNGPVFANGRPFAGATALALDDERAATVLKDGAVALWSVDTGRVLKTLPKPAVLNQSEHPGHEIESLCISPDVRKIAAVTRKGEIMIWLVPFP